MVKMVGFILLQPKDLVHGQEHMNLEDCNYEKKIIALCILIIVLGGIYLLNKNHIKTDIAQETVMKEDAIKKFYSSYEQKSIDIFNDSVIDSLKIRTEESENLRKLLYEDLVNFQLLELHENKDNPVQTINGKTYTKENIAEFTIVYKIDFEKNIFGEVGEGPQSVRKVIVRENKNSPWLVAGQIDGYGY